MLRTVWERHPEPVPSHLNMRYCALGGYNSVKISNLRTKELNDNLKDIIYECDVPINYLNDGSFLTDGADLLVPCGPKK